METMRLDVGDHPIFRQMISQLGRNLASNRISTVVEIALIVVASVIPVLCARQFPCNQLAVGSIFDCFLLLIAMAVFYRLVKHSDLKKRLSVIFPGSSVA